MMMTVREFTSKHARCALGEREGINTMLGYCFSSNSPPKKLLLFQLITGSVLPLPLFVAPLPRAPIAAALCRDALAMRTAGIWVHDRMIYKRLNSPGSTNLSIIVFYLVYRQASCPRAARSPIVHVGPLTEDFVASTLTSRAKCRP